MTIQELYAAMGADYDRAVQIMRRDRLIDRSVRRFASSNLCDQLMEAAATMDATALFEATHAIKGVSANLGITKLCDLAGVVADEFRAGNSRTLSDDEVKAKIGEMEQIFQNCVAAIKQYEAEA